MQFDRTIRMPKTYRAAQQPTMADLCERYLQEHAYQHKKASSAAGDKSNIDNHVTPLLGSRLVTEVTRADIDAFKRAVKDGKTATRNGNGPRSGYRGGAIVSGGPCVTNRCLALLSKMLNLAERWGMRPDGTNPVRHVEKYKENKVERYLSEDETGWQTSCRRPRRKAQKTHS